MAASTFSVLRYSLQAIMISLSISSINSQAAPISTSTPFDNIIFFGDSLSDPGNLFHILSYDINLELAAISKVTGITLKPIELLSEHPFYQHRVFTNEATWSDKTAELMGLLPTTGAFSTSIPAPPYTPYQSLLNSSDKPLFHLNRGAQPDQEITPPHQLLQHMFSRPFNNPVKLKDSPEDTLDKQALTHIANNFKLPAPLPQANNFAIANATAAVINPNKEKHLTDKIATILFNAMSLQHQIDAFLSLYEQKPRDNTAFIIMIGANDLFNAIASQDESYITDAVNAIQAQSERLLDKKGVRYLLISNMPELGSIPMYNTDYPQLKGLANQYSRQFNRQLEAQVLPYLKSKYTDKNINSVDTAQIFKDFLSYSETIGLNISNPCISDIGNGFFDMRLEDNNSIVFDIKYENSTSTQMPCSKDEMKSQYVFFDHVHPESKVHSHFAEHFCKALVKMKPESYWPCAPDTTNRAQ